MKAWSGALTADPGAGLRLRLRVTSGGGGASALRICDDERLWAAAGRLIADNNSPPTSSDPNAPAAVKRESAIVNLLLKGAGRPNWCAFLPSAQSTISRRFPPPFPIGGGNSSIPVEPRNFFLVC